MDGADLRLLCLSDERLAPLATGTLPAWLWNADADRVLWTNAMGAALLGAPTAAVVTDLRFAPDHPLAVQVARIATDLDHDARPRFERLRALDDRPGRLLTCQCRRVVVAGAAALLVTATEPAGPNLPLGMRTRRLLAGLPGALAAFTVEGELLFATEDAEARLAGQIPIGSIAAHPLFREASRGRHVAGQLGTMAIVIDRIGNGDATVLLLRLPALPEPTAATSPLDPSDADADTIADRPGQVSTLSPDEWSAFLELSRKLGQQLAGGAPAIDTERTAGDPDPASPAAPARNAVVPELENDLARARDEIRELTAVLDSVGDGVLVLDHQGVVRTANRSAGALLGRAQSEMCHRPLADAFAPESADVVGRYLAEIARNGITRLLDAGREVDGRRHDGRTVPLFLTIGTIDEHGTLCAMVRDLTAWKQAEAGLAEARRRAEQAQAAKSGLLAKISHEIRAPLSAIIGFSEIMMEERFGPLSNARYREYLEGIRVSGGLLIALISDLLELSMIETGRLELNPARVSLNELIRQCVTITQPLANRERIIIRSSLAPSLPPAIADARCVRQMVLNLMSDAIGLAGTGGQVIVSTARNDDGDAVLRVRDTGIGMNEQELSAALEPFRPPALTARGFAGTGLGLPLTKALAEANRARFQVRSSRRGGTLVEVAFPTIGA